jgi:hypothetical protein
MKIKISKIISKNKVYLRGDHENIPIGTIVEVIDSKCESILGKNLSEKGTVLIKTTEGFKLLKAARRQELTDYSPDGIYYWRDVHNYDFRCLSCLGKTLEDYV